MNRDEQKQILEFIERAVTGIPGSPMPAMDLEADAIIRALFVRNPEAAYRVTKLAMALASEVAALRAADGGAAETRPASPLGWLFVRRRAAATRPKPPVPVMEMPTNG